MGPGEGAIPAAHGVPSRGARRGPEATLPGEGEPPKCLYQAGKLQKQL